MSVQPTSDSGRNLNSWRNLIGDNADSSTDEDMFVEENKENRTPREEYLTQVRSYSQESDNEEGSELIAGEEQTLAKEARRAVEEVKRRAEEADRQTEARLLEMVKQLSLLETAQPQHCQAPTVSLEKRPL